MKKFRNIFDNKKMNRKYKPYGGVKEKFNFGDVPRFYFSKETKTQSPSVLVKCGDCDNKVRIYYDFATVLFKTKPFDNLIEINGVLAHKWVWRVLFKKIGLL